MEKEIRIQLIDLLKEKLQRLDIRERELDTNFDLVKNGFGNSLAFFDLVASLEKLNHIEINFEEGLNSGKLTTVGGLIRAFTKS